jgi:hypothetical protein
MPQPCRMPEFRFDTVPLVQTVTIFVLYSERELAFIPIYGVQS